MWEQNWKTSSCGDHRTSVMLTWPLPSKLTLVCLWSGLRGHHPTLNQQLCHTDTEGWDWLGWAHFRVNVVTRLPLQVGHGPSSSNCGQSNLRSTSRGQFKCPPSLQHAMLEVSLLADLHYRSRQVQPSACQESFIARVTGKHRLLQNHSAGLSSLQNSAKTFSSEFQEVTWLSCQMRLILLFPPLIGLWWDFSVGTKEVSM